MSYTWLYNSKGQKKHMNIAGCYPETLKEGWSRYRDLRDLKEQQASRNEKLKQRTAELKEMTFPALRKLHLSKGGVNERKLNKVTLIANILRQERLV